MLLHIDYAYFRQLHIMISNRQLHQSEFSRQRFIKRFHSRGCRTKQRFCAMHPGQHHGHITGIIPWSRVILFITRLMLFVDNDKPQSGKWKEQRRPSTYHHPRTRVMQHFFPYIHPLVIREFGMVNHHFFSEHILQSAGKLCCKGNFRNQEQRLVASG